MLFSDSNEESREKKSVNADQHSTTSDPKTDSLIDAESPESLVNVTLPLTPTKVDKQIVKKDPVQQGSMSKAISTLEQQLSPLIIESSSEERKTHEKTCTSDMDFPPPRFDLILNDKETKKEDANCEHCRTLQLELSKVKAEKLNTENELAALKKDLEIRRNELDREIQKRVEFEQQFTEKSERVRDQIGEFIAKSTEVDSKCDEVRKKLEFYNRNTSTMSEHFTTNRELLASQLLELKQENDFLLGQYLSKVQELESAEIDLPQSVEELQFYCLNLNEKLILATMAKERLEETLVNRDVSAVVGTSSNASTSA